MAKPKKQKIDIDKIMNQFGIKAWRRPFGPDPRTEELKARLNRGTYERYNERAETDGHGCPINFEQ